MPVDESSARVPQEPAAGHLASLGCPLLANIYLHPLDLRMQAEGLEMVRYADDFVILCRSKAEAEAALQRIREWMEAPDRRGGPRAWPRLRRGALFHGAQITL